MLAKIYKGDYRERQKQAIEDGVVCYIEHHLNSVDDPKIDYSLVLITENTSILTIDIADYYLTCIQKRLGVKRSKEKCAGVFGIKVIGENDRGYGSLAYLGKIPAMLVEPLFLSHWREKFLLDAELIINELAIALTETLMHFFRYGIIGLSPGHLFKESNPKDKGAFAPPNLYEGEIVYTVLKKTVALIEELNNTKGRLRK